MSAYDELGAEGFQRLAAALHARCLDDPVLNHPFTHADANPLHVPRLAAYLGEVFGGPPSGLDQSEMLELHAHQGMDDDLGDRFHACFLGALDDAGIAEGPVRQGFSAYMTWAVRDVLSYDDPASVVPPDLPMPTWST